MVYYNFNLILIIIFSLFSKLHKLGIILIKLRPICLTKKAPFCLILRSRGVFRATEQVRGFIYLFFSKLIYFQIINEKTNSKSFFVAEFFANFLLRDGLRDTSKVLSCQHRWTLDSWKFWRGRGEWFSTARHHNIRSARLSRVFVLVSVVLVFRLLKFQWKVLKNVSGTRAIGFLNASGEAITKGKEKFRKGKEKMADNDKGSWYQQQECTTAASPFTSSSRKKLRTRPNEKPTRSYTCSIMNIHCSMLDYREQVTLS